MAQDWDIKARGEACTQCQVPFADKQAYYAALVFETEGYQRGDYCEKCWEGKDKQTVLSYSTWKGVFVMPLPDPEPALRKETAESLLRKLMEDNDPAQGNVIYILAVMLERNRILAERDVRTNENGVLIRLYEHKKTGETFVVPDPGLRLNQLDKVQEEVVALLGGSRKTDGEAAATATKTGTAPAEPEGVPTPTASAAADTN